MDDSSCVLQKQCFKCKQFLPATHDFFWTNNRTKDHLATRCKQCFHIRNEKPIEGYKHCAACHLDLPRTSEHFSISRDRKDGLSATCKICRNKRRMNGYRVAKERGPKYAPPQTLVCRKCGEAKPATEQFFCKSPQSRYGLDALCKVCSHAANATNRQARIEERRVYEANYRKNHKEQEAARLKQWFQAGGNEIVKANTRNRRSRIRQAEGKHTAKEIREQYARQKQKCYYCHKPLRWGEHTVDHVIPISRGGSNSISNIVIACGHCNYSKNDRLPHEWPDGGRLF